VSTQSTAGGTAGTVGRGALPPVARPLAAVLGLLTVFAPISMDVYLPLLPALTDDLGASTSGAQLTVTACLLGLALGQLLAGPLSDRFGRRRPLLIGVSAFVVVSLLCAVSPSIEALVLARLVQGAAGGVGMVIAQAAGRDVYSGLQLLRFSARLTVLGGLAAVIGPMVGGQLAAVTSWRGIFVLLSALGVAILLACVRVFGETLPPARRTTGGLRRARLDVATVLQDRQFTGAVLLTGFVSAALFGYLAGATFVLQEQYGLSPQGYSYVFAACSAGFAAAGHLAGRSSRLRATLIAGLALCAAGSAGLLATAALDLPVACVAGSLFLIVSGVAVTSPPATTLALADHPRTAGTASALLGAARFAFGGLAAPLVGLGGAGVAPLAVVLAASTALAAFTYLVLLRDQRVPAASPTGTGQQDATTVPV
jgi:MFS transporter, DHA1 family, multidrug resistance protein